jgi:thiamine-phosphate pyrophosphorylase
LASHTQRAFPKIYAILDTVSLTRRGIAVASAAGALLDAGIRIVQFRHKGHFSRAVFEEARIVARLCHSAGATLVVNDRADVARLLDAGVHLGQDDLAPADARTVLGASRLLGYSTHNREQLAAGNLEPVDYLAIGPVFGTSSKENPDPVVGVEALAELRKLTPQPLVAIGGITLDNARQAFSTGIDSVAVIGGLLPEDGSANSLRILAERWLSTMRDMV